MILMSTKARRSVKKKSAVGKSRKSKRPTGKQLDTFGWSLAQGEHDGMPMFVRFRDFPRSFDRGPYPERIDVRWVISRPNKFGLPSDKEMDRMRAFEDALVDSLEFD